MGAYSVEYGMYNQYDYVGGQAESPLSVHVVTQVMCACTDNRGG